jgi:hypothetical protein
MIQLVIEPETIELVKFFILDLSMRIPGLNFALYMSLFGMIVRRLTGRVESGESSHPAPRKIIISVVVINNFRVQTSGFALFQADNPEYAAIIHVHCFAHMLNLVVSSSRNLDAFSYLVGRLFPLQMILQKHTARIFLGKMCPSLIPTQWLYMVDVLDFLTENHLQINSYLVIQHDSDWSIPRSIPKEFFELHAILLLFKIMLLAVESRNCTLSEIVPLVREVQDRLWKVVAILETATVKEILRIIMVRFFIGFLMNNHEEAIAAYS